MILWMSLSRDEYKLPEVVVDSIQELAEKCGVTPGSIYVSMCRSRKGIMPEKYCRVETSDNEVDNLIWGTDWAVDNGFEIDDAEYRKYLALCKKRGI